jgi:hypothetical protein
LTSNPEAFQYMLASFQKWDPSIKDMITPEESVREQLKVIGNLDSKTSGMLLSHRGTEKDWF